MGDGPVRPTKRQRPDDDQPTAAGQERAATKKVEVESAAPFQKQFQELLGMARSVPGAVDAEKHINHLWNESVSSLTGYKPEQIVASLKPEVVKSLNEGGIIEQELAKGLRKESNLSEKEKASLGNFRQMETAMSRIPGFAQDDFKNEIEKALRRRADSQASSACSPEWTSTGKHKPGPEPDAAAKERKPDSQGAKLPEPKDLGQQVRDSVNHLWNDGISKVSGYKPEDIADRLKPDVVPLIDRGRVLSEEIRSGRRDSASLKASEVQELTSYQKFSEQLKSVPLYEQNAFRQSVEDALHKRAQEGGLRPGERQKEKEEKGASLQMANEPANRRLSVAERETPKVSTIAALGLDKDASARKEGEKLSGGGSKETVMPGASAGRIADSGTMPRLPEVNGKAMQASAEGKAMQASAGSKAMQTSAEGKAMQTSAEGKAMQASAEGKGTEASGDRKAMQVSAEGKAMQVAAGGKGTEAPGDRKAMQVSAEGKAMQVSAGGKTVPEGKAMSMPVERKPVMPAMDLTQGPLYNKESRALDIQQSGRTGLPDVSKASGNRQSNAEEKNAGKSMNARFQWSEINQALRSLAGASSGGEARQAENQKKLFFETAKNLQLLEGRIRQNHLAFAALAVSPISGALDRFKGKLEGAKTGINSLPSVEVKGTIARSPIGWHPIREASGGVGRADSSWRQQGNTARSHDNGQAQLPVLKALTVETRIDRRYLPGVEVALAAIIAAAGVARRRPVELAVSPAERSVPVPASGGRLPVIPPGLARRLPGQEGNAANGSFNTQRIDRRYILGTELALAALIAAGGVARRRAGEPFNNQSERRQESEPGTKAKFVLPEQAAARTYIGARIAEQHFVPGADSALIGLLSAAGIERIRPFANMPAARSREGAQHLQPVVSERLEGGSSELAEVVPRQELGHRNEETKSAPGTDWRDSREGQSPQAAEEEKLTKKLVLHRPTTIVSTQDTLVSIAEAFFHDARLSWLIADLNSHNMTESYIDGKRIVELRSRQKIELPVWQDIEQFLRSKGPEARAENLVTIVSNSAIDREVIKAQLGGALGAKSAASQPSYATRAPSILPGQKQRAFGRWIFSRFLAEQR